MKIKIRASHAFGAINAPPSKSMAHRALICASLADGESRITGIADSDDIRATVGALRALGTIVNIEGDTATVKKGGVISDKIDCNESGSTLRFIIPLCLTTGRQFTLAGSQRLFSRSLSVYEKLCRERGIYFKQCPDSVTVKGLLTSGGYNIRGDISSQFISGLMFALPTLDGDSVINIEGQLESEPYLRLTASALSLFGVECVRTENGFFIQGNQHYTPNSTAIEGDCSNAAFFEALNLAGGDVTVTGIRPDTVQGDRVYNSLFEKIKNGVPVIDVSDCPDLAPVLMSAGALSNGVRLIGTHRLKIKESDRGTAMASELEKFGVNVEVYDDSIAVGHGIKPPTTELFGHNDHRIVMALSVLCVKTGGVIDGAQAVRKSMPDFFTALNGLGIITEEINEA